MEPTCSIGGCNRPRKCRGWCHTHYIRWYRHGDPLTTQTIHGDDKLRFWSKVAKTETCWMWHGTINKRRGGYGVFTPNGVKTPAHRYAYELIVGPIPKGLVLDHLCRVPACVNPAHLEPVTNAENVRRGMALKTHCPQGHEYTPENTYRDPKGTHGRQCRTCMSERSRRRYQHPEPAQG